MAEVEITIYRFTGRQSFLGLKYDVPRQWCEECDLTIALTRRVLGELNLENDRRVKLVIKPWAANAIGALASGGWHAPILLINDKVFSQGVVPDRARLKKVLTRLLNLPTAPADNSVAL